MSEIDMNEAFKGILQAARDFDAAIDRFERRLDAIEERLNTPGGHKDAARPEADAPK